MFEFLKRMFGKKEASQSATVAASVSHSTQLHTDQSAHSWSTTPPLVPESTSAVAAPARAKKSVRPRKNTKTQSAPAASNTAWPFEEPAAPTTKTKKKISKKVAETKTPVPAITASTKKKKAKPVETVGKEKTKKKTARPKKNV